MTLPLTFQYDCASGLTIYGFLSMFNSNIGSILDLLRDISLQNLGDFDISGSPKVKCDGVIGLTIYGLLLTVNNNIWPN